MTRKITFTTGIGDTTGWTYDFLTENEIAFPSSFSTTNVTSSSNFDPLLISSVSSYETASQGTIFGTIELTRIGTSTPTGGGFWSASYTETVNTGTTLVTKFESDNFFGFDAGYTVDLGESVQYSSVSGMTLGELIENGTMIFGTEYDDTLKTTNFAEVIVGGAGNDDIDGRGGNDDIRGGAGNDLINGGAGADTMNGGIGNDVYIVDSWGDVIIDASGKDEVRSASIYLNLKQAKYDGVENARLTGNLKINLVGDNDKNVLTGNDGNNVIKGNNGNDVLKGGDGNDKLVGGKGKDKLIGGEGKDKFVFTKKGGKDTIKDFEDGADKIDLSKFNFNNKSQALSKFFELGNNHDNKLGFKYKGTEIVIKGIDMDDLNGSDILI